MHSNVVITYSVGSNAKNDIVLTSRYVDAFHAKIEYKNGVYSIMDLNSKFGVFIDGNRIEEPHRLTKENHLKIGTYVLHWREEIELLLSPESKPKDFYWSDFLKWKGTLDVKTYRSIFFIFCVAPILVFIGVPGIVFGLRYYKVFEMLYSEADAKIISDILFIPVGLFICYVMLLQSIKRMRDAQKPLWHLLIPGMNLYWLLK